MSNVKTGNIKVSTVRPNNITSKEVIETLTGKQLDVVIEAMINMFVQKGILKNPEEFLDYINAIEISKQLSKED